MAAPNGNSQKEKMAASNGNSQKVIAPNDKNPKEKICSTYENPEFENIHRIKEETKGENFFVKPENAEAIIELDKMFPGNLSEALYYINSERLNRSIYFLYGNLLFILVMVILWFTAVKSKEFRTTYEGIFCNKLI